MINNAELLIYNHVELLEQYNQSTKKLIELIEKLQKPVQDFGEYLNEHYAIPADRVLAEESGKEDRNIEPLTGTWSLAANIANLDIQQSTQLGFQICQYVNETHQLIIEKPQTSFSKLHQLDRAILKRLKEGVTTSKRNDQEWFKEYSQIVNQIIQFRGAEESLLSLYTNVVNLHKNWFSVYKTLSDHVLSLELKLRNERNDQMDQIRKNRLKSLSRPKDIPPVPALVQHAHAQVYGYYRPNLSGYQYLVDQEKKRQKWAQILQKFQLSYSNSSGYKLLVQKIKNPKKIKQLAQLIAGGVIESGVADVNKAVKTLIAIYTTPSSIDTGRLFSIEEMVNHIASTHPSVAEKLKKELEGITNQLKTNPPADSQAQKAALTESKEQLNHTVKAFEDWTDQNIQDAIKELEDKANKSKTQAVYLELEALRSSFEQFDKIDACYEWGFQSYEQTGLKLSGAIAQSEGFTRSLSLTLGAKPKASGAYGQSSSQGETTTVNTPTSSVRYELLEIEHSPSPKTLELQSQLTRLKTTLSYMKKIVEVFEHYAFKHKQLTNDLKDDSFNLTTSLVTFLKPLSPHSDPDFCSDELRLYEAIWTILLNSIIICYSLSTKG